MHISAREAFQQIICPNATENGAAGYWREWYMRYLESCFREHFNHHLLPNLPSLTQTTPSVSSTGPENTEPVYLFLSALARQLMTYKRRLALCDIVDNLINENYDLMREGEDRMNLYELVLVAIGWLSLSMPHPSLHSNVGSKYEGRGVFVDREFLGGAHDQPVSMLLGKFTLFESMLDPPPLYRAYGQTHTSQYFMITTINFHTLREVTKIEINWTEQLPLHLKFDRTRRTLTLFAFPSVGRPILVNFSR
jgi:hypothetical protein